MEVLLSVQSVICFYDLLDEVGAIVADVGNFSSRFGAAGKDTPQHVFYTVRVFVNSSEIISTRWREHM